VRRFPRFAAVFPVFAFLFSVAASAQLIHGRDGIVLPSPPPTEASPVVDNYNGIKIADSYRWLEDAKSTETRAFIDAQNAYTERYLRQAKIRPQIMDDLTALVDVSSAQIPAYCGGSEFFLKRLEGEQQYSIFVRRNWTGSAVPPKDERLIDPAKLTRDPNTSIQIDDVSRDCNLIAYQVQKGGADEAEIHVFNVKTGRTLEDLLPTARYFGINFAPDAKSFYYARTDSKGTLVYLHQLGTRVSRDQLIFGHEFRGEPLGPDDLITPQVSDDGRYLVVEVDRGVPASRVDIVYRDLTKPGSVFDVLVWGIDNRFSAISYKGGWYVKTDYKAPKGIVMRADPGIMPDVWKTIVPEGTDVINDWAIVGGKVYVDRLKDVNTETAVYSLDGKSLGKVDHGGIGSSSGIFGRSTDRYAFFDFSSFIAPPAIFRLDTVTSKRDTFFQAKTPFDSSQYELKQVFFKSKDGTQIPMFIAGKKGLKTDGTERLLMTGYGGFDIAYTASWYPFAAWWLEQGGWFAVPNLRGGGEYGETWHEQGMFERKQNVFDDWFAAAEYLIANKYTSPQHFAIIGASNGGLLMGASITQRPELFSAVLCGYPLLDMLRFQKFLVGSFWTTEYGSSDNEKQFRYLLKYSPYQNVKPNTAYPAVMFFTGDSDTRVDPLHARKMTALMQAASSSGRPILLHSSVAGGHNGGMSVDQQVQDEADQLTFLWTETGPVGRSVSK
jgi:prolyl oligopeptidase